MPDSDPHQQRSGIRTLQMLYRGAVAAVLVYDWAIQRCPANRGELLAIRDLHHACQILVEERIHHLDADPDPNVLTWSMEMLARIGDADLQGIRNGLLACERMGWRALTDAFEDVNCELRCFLEDEIRVRAEEALARMSALAEHLTCDGG